MKPKLLIVELWGLGDLVIGTAFLRAAAARFNVTLLAKPYALDLQPRLWPDVKIYPFNAPWTAFKKKYHFWRWPLLEMLRLRRALAAEKFDYGFSSRWDPRDHLLLKIVGAKERIGFPRLGSGIFLTRPIPRPHPESHRYESWRAGGAALGINLPPREELTPPPPKHDKTILIHTGARLPVRVWPLENWLHLAIRLRGKNYNVQIACDPDQEDWWKKHGEAGVRTPETVSELINLADHAGALIGNDSGPGHLAALCGVPTFTIFGPQLPEWFAPLHPEAEWVEGKACPYKPCSDYCRFPKPFCIQDLSEDEVCRRAERFLEKSFAGNGTARA
ncbi:MAG TPA: glycosyltransferase family 9 protein [Candidatus Acidoferrum sp.]|nr:glycosyltransferase family 9 protein [Candidatus Acidoferrum sp.]